MDKKARIATVIALVAAMLLLAGAVAAKRAKPACRDGIDNDGDGLVDLADPGCDSKWDGTETNPNIQCDDGTDNDGDGLVDLADPGCDSLTDNDEYNFVPQEPDSCSDTDGGVYEFIFGTTSGFLNNQAYSNDDYCIDGKNVMEFSCNGDYETSQAVYCGDDYISEPYCFGPAVYVDDVWVYCGEGECAESVMPWMIEICDNWCENGACV